MRRKGHVPFSRRGIGAKNTSPLDKAMMGSGGDLHGDPMYSSMQRGLSDGMNHITKSILHHGGVSGRGATLQNVVSGGRSDGSLGLVDGDLVSSTGELQTPRRENIPLRPLMLNGNGTTKEKFIPSNYE